MYKRQEYGKALLLGENITQDIPKAMDCLEKAVRLGNLNAKRFLALEYISGEPVSYTHLDVYKRQA